MVDGKKDQFYLDIDVDNSIEFAYGKEYCLTVRSAVETVLFIF